MTRYKSDKCYAYVDAQADMLSSAKKSVTDKQSVLDISNTSRKTSLDIKTDEIVSEIDTFANALSGSSYTPT